MYYLISFSGGKPPRGSTIIVYNFSDVETQTQRVETICSSSVQEITSSEGTLVDLFNMT